MEQYGYSVDVVRSHNLKLITRLLYKKPMSCKELSGVLGLSETAIKKNIVQLKTHNIITVFEDYTREKKEVGRQHIRFTINDKFGAFVLIDLSHNHDSFLIKDFKGNDLYYEKLTLGKYIYKKDIFEISDRINDNLKKLGYSVKGIAVAVAGQVLEETGEILFSSRMETDVKNIKALLHDYFGIDQIFIKNDIRFCVFGDKFYLQRSEKKNSIYIYVGYGVTCAILEKGKIISGVNDIAGEIGQSVCSDGVDLHEHCSMEAWMRFYKFASIEECVDFYKTNKDFKEKILQSATILAEKVQIICDALGCDEVVLLGDISRFGDEYVNAFYNKINSGICSFKKKVECFNDSTMRQDGMFEVLKNNIISLIS